MRYEIKDRWEGKLLYGDEAVSFQALLEAAVKAKANLYGANLVRANLDGANLDGANLDGANLDGANLVRANLVRANLDGANLYGYFCFGPGGSRNSYTWARWEERGYMVHCGCKTLPLKDFVAVVRKTHGNSYHAKWYAANIKTMALVAKESKPAFDKRAKKKA